MMLSVAATLVGIPILRCPQQWEIRLCELDTFFIAFTLVCTALLLWPHSEPATVQH